MHMGKLLCACLPRACMVMVEPPVLFPMLHHAIFCDGRPRKMAFLKTLVIMLSLTSTLAQRDNCDDVQSGLVQILDPCRQSVQTCVEAMNLAATSALFCLPEARRQYNNFLECSGPDFTNQVFGALCSGANCTQGPFAECVFEDRCFEQVGLNTGVRAYETCQCNSNLTLDGILSDCPLGCASDLEQLMNDQDCCVQTTPYVLYFSTCGSQEEDSNDAINRLFNACNVTLPDPCYQPFQDSSSIKTVQVTAVLMLTMTVAAVTFV